jgi:xanthine phosphoribosyltransferase
MRKYTPEEFLKDCEILADMVKEYNPKIILPIARGGLTFAHLLSEILDIRDVYCINSIGYEKDKKLKNVKVFNTPIMIEKRVLIVDDIADSGETLKEVLKVLKEKNPTCEFKTATLFYKKNSIVQPDYTLHEATEWIEYFWNK